MESKEYLISSNPQRFICVDRMDKLEHMYGLYITDIENEGKRFEQPDIILTEEEEKERAKRKAKGW